MLIASLRKKTDPSSETRAVIGRKDEATETGIFLMEAYQQNDMADKNKPK